MARNTEFRSRHDDHDDDDAHLAKRYPAVLRLYFAIDNARVALPLGTAINFMMDSNSTTLRYFK